MSHTVKNRNTVHQGRNVRFAREFRGVSQEDLGFKINKYQSEMSKIENQVTVADEILEQVALALEVSADFLRTFDFEDTAKNYYNYSTNEQENTFAENSHDTVNQNNQYQIEEEVINNNIPLEEAEKLADRFLQIQKELLEDKHQLDKENALLKQELEFLKSKK